jgi:hypothetical protein
MRLPWARRLFIRTGAPKNLRPSQEDENQANECIECERFVRISL